ncbi:Cation/H(+) antiporter 15, partial [Mucuna pruriens]
MVYVLQVNQLNSFTIQRYSKGIFYDNPLNYTISVITLQASLVCLSTTWLQFFLIPLGETTFVPQVLAGLLTGPSILGQINKNLRKWLFAPKAFYVCEAISLFGTMMFLFLVAVKTDPSMVIKTGKKTWVIGLCSSLFPLIFSISSAFLLRKILNPETDLYKSIFYIAAFSSTGSFQATASLLEDFKLLNSEVGRLAISSSMVNGVISSVWQGIILSRQKTGLWKKTDHSSRMIGISFAAIVLFILFVLRPIMLWMIRQTPKGKPIKESYIVSIYVMVLVCSLLGEIVGEPFWIGPLILGLAVPEGPPLGSALVERLDTLISGVLMPLFYFSSGARFKLHLVNAHGLAIVQPVAISGFFGKVVGTMLPSMYCKMPLIDALSLGLIMATQGITQLGHLQSLQQHRVSQFECEHVLQIIDDQSYAQMVIALIWLTAASTPIVKFLYDPSKRYLSFKRRRTIEHAPPHAVLPLMACMHCEENTPPIINVLEMSKSTTESPICFYVLHLIQLTGRTVPVLIDHHPNSWSNTLRYSQSQNIINAFKSYEKQNKDSVTVKLFTSISPYETMHDEICMQAAEKMPSMLIVPFHKRWREGQISELAPPIRALNRNLLRTAPCSVAILVERGYLTRINPLTTVSFYSVGIVFIEGPDDREALSYAIRMADHPNVKVTVIRLMEPRRKSKQLISRDPDGDLIHKFKVDCIKIKRHDYREEIVRDGEELVGALKSLEGCYDLILVGRRHQSESPLFQGLTEWSEYPELGFVGDMLVSSDSTFDGSVLVVQQQNRAAFVPHDLHLDNSVHCKQEPLITLEVDLNITSNSSSSLNTTLWICEHTTKFQRFTSKGIFYGENPLNDTLSAITLQASLICLSATWLQFLLIPLGESTFVSQVLAGLLTGPSVLGQIKSIRKWLFPPKSYYACETISLFGSIMFLFLMGVKIDPYMVMRTGRKTWAIGVCSCVFPIVLSIFSAFVLRRILNPETDLYKSLLYIAVFLSSGSFQVTARLLKDLKLLNSEVGRLALSSSMVSGTVSAVWETIIITRQQTTLWKQENKCLEMMLISLGALLLFILCILRPIMFWMIRKTPKGEPIRESYIVSIFLMVLLCSLFGELIGEHFMIGPILLGLAVPEGPPLGSALVERLDTFLSGVLMPLFYFSSGARFKIHLIDFHDFAIVQPVALFCFCGKVIGTMLPSMYCNMPLVDALSLGLLMSAQGITHLLYLQTCQYLRIIDDESYAQMLISLLWLTAAATPMAKFLYDPSKSYSSQNKKRSIEHAPRNAVFPLMACIHFEEDTPPIINILEMSNSTTENPICLYVVHLIQLAGRSAPLLIDHQPSHRFNSLHFTQSHNIINAFKYYEQQKMGNVMVKLFTSISPYETMHNEICMQAAKKRACMLIVPFHRKWQTGQISESAHPIRALNRHLLRTAPCSVGILAERGYLIRNNPLTTVSFYSVGIVFIEGPDDREALSYAMRMAYHPNVTVTVIRLIEPRKKSRKFINRDPDGDLIHRFKVDYLQIKRHDYREEVVRDSLEMISVIRSLEGRYDLILVGRRHDSESSLFSGLTEWNEYPELGSVGDMLVSSDSTFDGSVLVVQQQNRVGVGHHDLHLDNSVYNKQEPLTILEVPRDTKEWGLH